MNRPVIIGQSSQPTTGSTLVDGQQAPQHPAYRPQTTSQKIVFVGSLTDGQTFPPDRAFTVLAGEGAPTVTGGFARWNVISRPQRVGITVPDGYDPITMDVPIMFDAVVNATQDVEGDIQILEWMGGRGLLYSKTKVGHPAHGDSPLVTVFTANAQGSPTNLVPAQYQTDDLRWVVTGIAYDANPLRNRHGDRIRQKATVTLTQHVSGPGTSGDSPAARARARQSLDGKYMWFPVTERYNTIRKITVFCAHNQRHAAAVAVLEANRGDKKLRLGPSVDADLTQHLPLGTKIKVPLSVMTS